MQIWALSKSPCRSVYIRVCAHVCVCMPEIMLRILQITEETRAIVMETQRSVKMLKLSGLGSRNGVETTDDLVLQLIQESLATEELESFNSQLSDRKKYNNVVREIGPVTAIDFF